jgi:dihydropteroate synthase
VKGNVALIREQGVDFAVVAVKAHVMNNVQSERDDLVAAYTLEFGVPAVLMAQDSRGTPTYYGRRDLVNFLANVFVEQLPWREFTIRAA